MPESEFRKAEKAWALAHTCRIANSEVVELLSSNRLQIFETGHEGPELEGKQVEKKSKAAQTNPKKLIRRTCPSGHGSDGSGPKWHAPFAID